MIGRKNWLFSFTEKGATTTCAYYSIMKTAIENGLESERYPEFLFTEFGSNQLKMFRLIFMVGKDAKEI